MIFENFSHIRHFKRLNVNRILRHLSEMFNKWYSILRRAYSLFIIEKTCLFKQKTAIFQLAIGKMKLIFLIYTFFRTRVQKIGDGCFLFFLKGFGLADIWPFFIDSHITSLCSEIIEVKKRKWFTQCLILCHLIHGLIPLIPLSLHSAMKSFK